MGRVLLAGLSDTELAERLEHTDLHALTKATTTSPTTLHRELERVRRQGFAIVDQELEDGLRSIAAPIPDASGDVVAALNVSTHTSRATTDDLERAVLPRLLETATAVSRDLAAIAAPR